MKIMIIGMFGKNLSGEPLAQGFERKGCQVIRISVEPEHPKRSGKFDLHIMDNYATSRTEGMGTEARLTEAVQLQRMYRRLNLRTIVQLYPDCDLIFFIQNKYAWDFEGVTIPIYYYHTDLININLPLHADLIKGFFYAYIGAADEMLDNYTYDFNHWYWRELIPYGCDPTLYHPEKSWEERTIFCGFMGSLAQNNHSKNGLKAHIYDDRNRILKALIDRNYNGFVMQRFSSVEEYAEFLGNCQVGINIPGTYGRINQRQYEVLASGCLLLQYWYPELKQLGLTDFENCLTFTSMDSLLDKLQWIQDHSNEANDIRLKGNQYFKDHRCSWQERAEDMLDRITRAPTSHDQEWIDFVKYQRQKESNPYLKEEYPVQMFKVK